MSAASSSSSQVESSLSLTTELSTGSQSPSSLEKLVLQWQASFDQELIEHPSALASRLMQVVQDQGASADRLAELIQALPALKELTLKEHRITPKLQAALEKSELRSLTLDRCYLTADMLETLPKTLKTLRCFHPLLPGSRRPPLQRLEVRHGMLGRRLGPEEAVQIAGLKGLERLTLHTTAITDPGLRALKQLKGLRVFKLTQTFDHVISTSALVEFLSCIAGTLEELALSHQRDPRHDLYALRPVQFRGLSEQSFPYLRKLRIAGFIALQDRDLAELLTRSPALTHLRLSPSLALTGRCLAEAAERLGNLRVFEMIHPQRAVPHQTFHPEHLNTVLKAIKKIQKLSLDVGVVPPDARLDMVPVSWPFLSRLRIGWTLSPLGLRRVLLGSPHIRSLSLCQKMTSAEWLEAFAPPAVYKINGIRSLELDRCQHFPGAVLEQLLDQARFLKHLKIDRCQDLGSDLALTQAAVPSLKVLASRAIQQFPSDYPKILLRQPMRMVLRSSTLSDHTLNGILRRSAGVESLELDRTLGVEGVGWSEHQAVFSKLKSFTAIQPQPPREGLGSQAMVSLFSAAQSLESLKLAQFTDLSGDHVTALPDTALRSLKRIELEHCAMDTTFFRELLECSSGSLRQLSLSHCRHADIGKLKFAKRPSRFPHLRKFKVVASSGIDVGSLFGLIRVAPQLQSLELLSTAIQSRQKTALRRLCKSRDVQLRITPVLPRSRVEGVLLD